MSDTYKIKKLINNLFRIVFRLPNDKINERLTNKNLEKWDSLNHVNLILAIESMFKISIDPKKAMYLTSYKKIYEYLKNNETKN
tara:strand:+ start:135 stop:386 length:252 start_codon:yes stop_codon:yes gene_type:complete